MQQLCQPQDASCGPLIGFKMGCACSQSRLQRLQRQRRQVRKSCGPVSARSLSRMHCGTAGLCYTPTGHCSGKTQTRLDGYQKMLLLNFPGAIGSSQWLLGAIGSSYWEQPLPQLPASSRDLAVLSWYGRRYGKCMITKLLLLAQYEIRSTAKVLAKCKLEYY